MAVTCPRSHSKLAKGLRLESGCLGHCPVGLDFDSSWMFGLLVVHQSLLPLWQGVGMGHNSEEQVYSWTVSD